MRKVFAHSFVNLQEGRPRTITHIMQIAALMRAEIRASMLGELPSLSCIDWVQSIMDAMSKAVSIITNEACLTWPNKHFPPRPRVMPRTAKIIINMGFRLIFPLFHTGLRKQRRRC